MDLKAKGDSLVEGQLRLFRAVNVDALLALHELAVVIEPRLNDTIANRFGDNEFRIFGRIEHQLGCDIRQRDARIRQRNRSNSSLDDVVAKPNDEGVSMISLRKNICTLDMNSTAKSRLCSYLENFAIVLENLIESVDISQTDSLSHLEVRSQGMPHGRLSKDVSFRYITQQQFDGNQQLLNGLLEPDGSVLWRFAQSLQKVCVCLHITQFSHLVRRRF